MKIIIASDSYKGCLSSKDISDTISETIKKIDRNIQTFPINIADGGEGTVDAIAKTLNGVIVSDIVSDPLGRPIYAKYGIVGKLAIIESAAACGLTLLKVSERNPLITTTRGLGELILAAIRRGCERFIIGLGGSATNDGGMGMISVPDFLEMTKGKEFTVACDVDIPFIGPNGTSRNFSPQKGATADEVEILEEKMKAIATRILAETGIDVSTIPGAGAAGGLGGAFKAYLGATMKSGINLILDALDFDSLLKDVDLVITGEGCSDFQTIKGKAPFGILQRAKRMNIPVALLSGRIQDFTILEKAGFSHIIQVSPNDKPLSFVMQPEIARDNLILAVSKLLTMINFNHL